jgi:hypothetical protein
MTCIVRIVKKDSYATFGETNVRCYYTFRCDKSATETGKCAFHNTRKIRSVVQFQSTYDHGIVSEPIYDHSHIYGGAWYNYAIKKHGAIAADDLRIVLQYHEEAHRSITSITQIASIASITSIASNTHYKEDKPDTTIQMPRKAKVTTGKIIEVEESAIPPLSPSQAAELKAATDPKPQEKPEKPKRTRKPKLVEDPKDIQEAPKEKPKRAPKKPVKTQVKAQVKAEEEVKLQEKEVVVPTHIEDTLEETEEYEIEFVKLTPFQLGDTMYFRDERKNKLYAQITPKKIGAYVGKLYNDTIYPEQDSDEE